jgi:hypothetical protein
MKTDSPKEGLQVLRLIMVLSSMSPLFILWAVRGTGPVPDQYFLPVCIGMAALPTLLLCLRIQTAQRANDCQVKTVHRADDHRDRILVYLFAMLLPFYSVKLNDWREFSATTVALIFIIFLFWHLNMHYMNLIFAARGYRVFTVTPDPHDPVGSKVPFVVLTKRSALPDGTKLETYRLSDTVFIEK